VKTILFDMDGTLTEPRKKINNEIARLVIDLTKIAKVGIVTGSGFDYIEDQCSKLWDSITASSINNLILMPCNGTQFYEYKSGSFKKTYNISMKSHITVKRFEQLIRSLIQIQLSAVSNFKFPLTGNFISYRGSMINYCPIGRDASNYEREKFKKLDKKFGIRDDLIAHLSRAMKQEAMDKLVTWALGGSTSIDIYPKGWDKTYAFNHVNVKDCYFIGDKCFDSGNDRQIYEKVAKEGIEAFNVRKPADTIKIIKNNILPQLGEN
jgi:phosphomannomutase